MSSAKHLAVAASRGVIAGTLAFVCIFGGGLAWEVSQYPNDGQAGLGPFIYALFIAPTVTLVTFIISYLRK